MTDRAVIAIVTSSWGIAAVCVVVVVAILAEIRDEIRSLREQLIQLGMDIRGLHP